MKLKKTISVILCICVCVCAMAVGFSVSAEGTDMLKFHEDGTFKIMMVNDTQDDQTMNGKTVSFLKKAIEQQKPDLAVVAGDILSDIWPLCNESKIDSCIKNLCDIFESTGTPFAITMGNHDHDRADEASSVEHIMELATSYSMHVSIADGCDPATYSVPIYSADGSSVKYVVYVMDSNNKGEALSMSGYTGLTQAQIDWYKAKAAEYKAANGGYVVNSTVIQHVPVAEIYNFLTAIPTEQYLDSDSVFSSNDYKWYKLNTTDYADMTGVLGEAPCSEITSTGEYQAWVDSGDVVSAFFAHDHVNTFAATTSDGIYMGYNGGTGFNSYGNGANRSIRIINIDANDTTKVDTSLIYYKDVCGENFSMYVSDIISPTLITKLMKFIYLLPSLFARIGK